MTDFNKSACQSGMVVGCSATLIMWLVLASPALFLRPAQLGMLECLVRPG